ncbi:MAG TPA: hypothetical protein VFB79_23845 [Candidatus Angelobacter sp.]|nr:hypothetical protein [Candidatus Angelobacter sp.]
MTNVNAIDSAKEAYKAALLAQVEPINKQILEVKAQLATLENQKRMITAQINLIDRKPGQGRAWTPEAKKRLSDALKASFAKKKQAAEAAKEGAATATPVPQGTQPPAPIIDNKTRAAGDDQETPAAATKKQTTKKTGTR